jgi:hypothetical protein
MPSNKILTILIICIGVITSVWLFQRKPEKISVKKDNTEEVSSLADIGEDTNDGWKDALNVISPKDDGKVKVISSGALTTDKTDSTLTAQMAKDFFGMYLNHAKGGDITSTDADQIASQTLLSPNYSKISGAVYYEFNLHITSDLGPSSISEYKNNLIKSIGNRLQNSTDNPINLVGDAMQNNNPLILAKLDPMIKAREAIISDLLKMNVPKDAIGVHLALLNAYSNFNTDLNGFRSIFDDPVKGILAINQYQKDTNVLKTALDNVNLYFSKK